MLRFLKSICWWHRYVQFTKTHPHEHLPVGTSHDIIHDSWGSPCSPSSLLQSLVTPSPPVTWAYSLTTPSSFPLNFLLPLHKDGSSPLSGSFQKTPLVCPPLLISLHSPVHFSVPSPPPEIISLSYICTCFQLSPLLECMLHENGDHIHRIHLCVPSTVPYT